MIRILAPIKSRLLSRSEKPRARVAHGFFSESQKPWHSFEQISLESGGTVIDLGTLLVDNAQALGTGDVTVNGGVLAADPQPINVLGNYTQNAGGTLQLNIAGPANGQFDVLNVAGNAALNAPCDCLTWGINLKMAIN
jgi:hypothetical protein